MQDGPTKVRLRADRFKEMAARRNETNEDVARGAGVDRFHIYRLLRGQHTPTTTTRKKILAHFGVAFDDLFEIVDNNTAGPRA